MSQIGDVCPVKLQYARSDLVLCEVRRGAERKCHAEAVQSVHRDINPVGGVTAGRRALGVSLRQG